MTGSLRLTAIVPATDDPSTLAECRAAIEAAVDPPEETIVVTAPRGSGPAAARNDGARDASGAVLVFVDADVVVHRDVFTRIRAAFEEDPALAGVFGSYDDDPADRRLVSSFRNLLHHHVHQASPGPAGTFWAGLGAVRRDAFMACGGFDCARFTRPSIEDIELGMRLTERGERVLLDPALLGKHLKSWSVATMVRTDVLHRGVPWVALLLGRRTGSSSLNLGWRHRLSAASAAAALVSLVAGRRVPAGAAIGAQIALNRSFYALLWRRRGGGHAIAGVALHALHLLSAVAAVPLGIGLHARSGDRSVSWR